MSSALKRDHNSILDRQFEAAGHVWRNIKADFDESSETDELRARIQFQNEDGTTRLLEMTLSKAAVCNDGKYRVEVNCLIEGWLWGQDRNGNIRFMGFERKP